VQFELLNLTPLSLIASGWEGINKRNESEDLPPFQKIIIKLRDKKLEKYYQYFS
jgi:hypothetical protein